MRNFWIMIVSLILLTGCVSKEVKEGVKRQAARGDNMVAKIDSGETTREEEQNYIRALRVFIWSLNYDFNDAELPADIRELLEKLKLLEEDN